MDILSLAAGAVILAIGYGSGQASGYLRGKRAAIKNSNEPPKPICGCGHGAEQHRSKTGKCEFHKWDRFEERNFHCTCQNYVGPEPMTTLYAPEITGD